MICTNLNAEFLTDMSESIVLKELEVPTINDLGIGEFGYISSYFRICLYNNNNIGINKLKRLETRNSKYITYMKVTRKPKGLVSIITEDTKTMDILENRRLIALSIAEASPCKSDVFVIDTIDGAKKTSELVSIVKKMAINPANDEEPNIIERLRESVKNSKGLEISNITGTPKPKRTWRVTERKSKIDDTSSVTLSLDSNEEVYTTFGSVLPTFIIRCIEDKTDAYIITGRMLDDDKATIRLGNENAYSLSMIESTDKKALFFPRVISNIKKIGGHKEMVFRYTPYNSGKKTITFNISGLMDKIKPLRKACHW